MGIASFWELFIVFLFGTLFAPLPIGVPPLPENPALIRAAPHDSVAFFEWFGSADAAGGSRNQTERLAAEPELRQLVIALRNGMREMVVAESGDEVDAGAVFDAVAHCVERPGCVFAFDFELGRVDVDMSIGVIVDLGQGNAAMVERGMQEFRNVVGDYTDAVHRVGDVVFKSLGDCWWSIVDGYLVVAYGDNAPERVLAGLRGDADHKGLGANASYTGARGRAAVARPTFRSFVDVAQIIETVGPVAGNEFGMARAVLGLERLQALVTESGLEGTGFVQRTVLSTDGMPQLFGLVAGDGLAPGDFAHVPADSTVAFGLAVSPGDLVGRIADLADGVMPGASEQMRTELFGELDGMLDLDVERELLAHLDDAVTVWSSPSSGGDLVYNGLTAAVKLRDAKAFHAGFAKLTARIEKVAPKKERRRNGRIRSNVYVERIDGHTAPIWFLNAVGEEWIAAPSICATDSHLLISLFPQSIVDILKRGPDTETLDRDAEFAEHVASADGALSAVMLDAGALVELLYPIAQIGVHLALTEVQRAGFDVDIRTWPRKSSLSRHLAREFGRTEISERGLTIMRRGVVPTADPLLAMVLPLFGFRAAGQARALEARAVERARVIELQRAKQEKAKRK